MLYFKKAVAPAKIVVQANVGEMNRKYRFSYHWVRQTNMWSVHFKKECIHREHIICNVTCESKINKTQPYRTMQGFATEIIVEDNKITIK
jgi:hypothetical protein